MLANILTTVHGIEQLAAEWANKSSCMMKQLIPLDNLEIYKLVRLYQLLSSFTQEIKGRISLQCTTELLPLGTVNSVFAQLKYIREYYCRGEANFNLQIMSRINICRKIS
jgi:hypothetical protein